LPVARLRQAVAWLSPPLFFDILPAERLFFLITPSISADTLAADTLVLSLRWYIRFHSFAIGRYAADTTTPLPPMPDTPHFMLRRHLASPVFSPASLFAADTPSSRQMFRRFSPIMADIFFQVS